MSLEEMRVATRYMRYNDKKVAIKEVQQNQTELNTLAQDVLVPILDKDKARAVASKTMHCIKNILSDAIYP